MIVINIHQQTLIHQGKTYVISTATNGTGEVEGSFCTPTGRFKVGEKFGDNLAMGSVLVARTPTGEVYSQMLANKHPNRDWILTRILWLDGLEAHNQNTKERYIYIHGSPDQVLMGVSSSKGCVRMRNVDIIALFDKTKIGENVVIIKK